MEREFHRRLVAESDKQKRKQLYAHFYSELTVFFRQHDHGKTSFGSFTPELMHLLAPFVRGTVVLDYGCGYGVAAFELAKHASRVIAVDVSELMIEEVRRRVAQQRVANIDPVCLGDRPEAALEIRDGTVDVVYSNDVVEHLHPDDMRDHLALAGRLLRPGGLYVCITPNRVTGPHDVSSQFLPYHAKAEGAHIREYSHRELCRAFCEAGFTRFRTPVTAIGYNRLRSDAAYRRLLVPPQWKFVLEEAWFARAKKHRPKWLNLFCINKVILFAWKP